MRGRQRGFSLAELMGVIAALGVIGVLLVYGISRLLATGAGENQAEATEQATAWAIKMHLKDASVICTEAISGKHGMVPCSVSVSTGGAFPAIWQLECGAAVNLNGQKGCRVTSQPMMPVPVHP